MIRKWVFRRAVSSLSLCLVSVDYTRTVQRSLIRWPRLLLLLARNFTKTVRLPDKAKLATLRLTHSYLLSGEDQPICTQCDTVLTLKHILLDCPELRDVRLKYFTASSLKDIFESVDSQSIFGFIKDVHFYNQL